MSGIVVLIVALSLLVPLGLYVLIREEIENTRIVDRETAEREAQARGGIDDRPGPNRRFEETDTGGRNRE